MIRIRANRRGFTLIEMLVVIGIIALAAALAMPAAANLANGYALTGEQAKLLAALSQARALAIRHRICYSVVFNDVADDAHWYAVYQHPLGDNRRSLDPWDSIWQRKDPKDEDKAIESPYYSINKTDMKEWAGRFLNNQVGARRRIAPGVHFGWFRPDPTWDDFGAWTETASAYTRKDKTETGDTDAGNAAKHLREGFGLNRIKFAPTGEVLRVDWPDKAVISGSGIDLTMSAGCGDPSDGETGGPSTTNRQAASTHTNRYGGSDNLSDPREPMQFFITCDPPDDLPDPPPPSTPYFIIPLTVYGDMTERNYGSGKRRVNFKHVGIGVARGTGLAVAKTRWSAND